MKLRPYQKEASSAVTQAWEEFRSALVVMPTGTGKTILAADIARKICNPPPTRTPQRVLFLAHRKELIHQAVDKLTRAAGLNCSVEMGDIRMDDDGLLGATQVVVSSIQTQCAGGDGGGRMAKFDPRSFGAVIVDEAHHAPSPSYRRVLDYYRSNTNLRIMGITATPDRADEEALGQVFDTVAYDFEILDAIHEGWLVPIDQQMVSVSGLDFSEIKTTAGDLNGAQLAKVMEAERALQEIAGPTIDIVGKRRAIVFTSSVKHAENLCNIFNRHREGMAGWVCGQTEDFERARLLEDFRNGKVQVVCNCNVLTEGFDDCGVEIIVMGRPTKSRSLYCQMIGRATRPLAGVVDGPPTAEERRNAIEDSKKPSCLVVDFVGNSGKHKLITSADILGGKVSDRVIERAIARAQKSDVPVRMSELMDEEDLAMREEARQRRLQEEARKQRLIAKASYSSKYIDPFAAFDITPEKQRGWDNCKTISDKQRDILLRQGINPDEMPYVQAKQLLNEIFRRWNANQCSYKQASILAKRGLPTNVTFEQASAMITEIAARENWRKIS